MVSELSPDDLIYVFGDVSNVFGIQAGHGYSTISGEVDVSLINQGLALLGVETGEAARYAKVSGMLRVWDRKGSHLNMPI